MAGKSTPIAVLFRRALYQDLTFVYDEVEQLLISARKSGTIDSEVIHRLERCRDDLFVARVATADPEGDDDA